MRRRHWFFLAVVTGLAVLILTRQINGPGPSLARHGLKALAHGVLYGLHWLGMA